MTRFRRLMLVVLLSGALAGLLLFAVQHVALVPLIETAETYEEAAARAMPDMGHEDEGWQPADGIERTLFSAASAMLTGIGFAALLFGAAASLGGRIDLRRGLLWGLAGFACFALAPSLGLPPKPPGAAVADLYARQLWWGGTVVATAAGLWLLVAVRGWPLRLAAIAVLALPHLVGAPAADTSDLVPAELMTRFAVASVAASAVFWLALGAIGGFLYSRILASPAARGAA